MNPTAQQLFPIGCRVLLRYAGNDETGIVTGYERGKVVVHWPDWNREGQYHACSLIAMEDGA
jgi:hypothetical protein